MNAQKFFHLLNTLKSKDCLLIGSVLASTVHSSYVNYKNAILVELIRSETNQAFISLKEHSEESLKKLSKDFDTKISQKFEMISKDARSLKEELILKSKDTALNMAELKREVADKATSGLSKIHVIVDQPSLKPKNTGGFSTFLFDTASTYTYLNIAMYVAGTCAVLYCSYYAFSYAYQSYCFASSVCAASSDALKKGADALNASVEVGAKVIKDTSAAVETAVDTVNKTAVAVNNFANDVSSVATETASAVVQNLENVSNTLVDSSLSSNLGNSLSQATDSVTGVLITLDPKVSQDVSQHVLKSVQEDLAAFNVLMNTAPSPGVCNQLIETATSPGVCNQLIETATSPGVCNQLIEKPGALSAFMSDVLAGLI